MSLQGTTKNPDPYIQNRVGLSSSVPSLRIQHLSGINTLTATSALALTSDQLLFPLILNNTSGGNLTYTLPSANTLQDIYGTVSKVQVGDVYLIQTVSLPTSVSTVTFALGTGGSGAVRVIPAYSVGAATNVNNLILTFTATADTKLVGAAAAYTVA